MALFGLFKSKQEKESDALMNKCMDMIFPLGEVDITRDCHRIGIITKGKLQGDDLRRFVIGCKTLVAVSGMMGGEAYDDDGFVSSFLHRSDHRISEREARDVYVYLAGESMYRVRLTPMFKDTEGGVPDEYIADARRLWEHGTSQDNIPGGYGDYGLSLNNPVPTICVTGSNKYLSRLRKNGCPVDSERQGSTKSEVISGNIDIYSISQFGQKICNIYICPYHRKDSKVAPIGFTLA